MQPVIIQPVADDHIREIHAKGQRPATREQPCAPPVPVMAGSPPDSVSRWDAAKECAGSGQ